MPFVLGLFITLGLYPISKKICKKTKLNKTLVNGLCILVTGILVMLCVSLIGFGIYLK